MPTPRAAVLIALILVIVFSTPAQPPANPALPAVQALSPSPQASQPVPTLHVTARTVILEVTVTDSAGNPVRGLKPSAFILLEDSVPQKLSTFNEHTTSEAPAVPEPSLPPNTFAVQAPPPESVTKTVIVLDNLHYPSHPLVRADLLAFMKTVPPGNPIGIMRIDWQGLHLVQDFTSDPQLLEQAVASKRILSPLPALNVFPWIGCEIPYQGVAHPYQRLANYLDGTPGRINLAWVTDAGHPNDYAGQEYPDLTSLNGSRGALQLGRITLYAIKAGGAIGGILQPLDHPDVVLSKLYPEQEEPFQPSCPLMPPATGSLLDNQALADFAAKLGGHAFFDGTTKALSQIIALGDDYYTLSYTPTNSNWNGAYRKIDIRVAGASDKGHPGFGWGDYGQPNVAYRPGYYALSKPTPSSPSASAAFGLSDASTQDGTPISLAPVGTHPRTAAVLELAMGFGTPTPSQIAFTSVIKPSPHVEAAAAKDTFIAAAFRSAVYRDYDIHYWIDPSQLKFTQTSSGAFRDDLQFAIIVYGDDGLVVNSLSLSTHIQVSAQDYDTIRNTGVTLDRTIAIPINGDTSAEHFYLRTGVLEVSTGHIGAIEISTDRISLPPAQSIANASPQP